MTDFEIHFTGQDEIDVVRCATGQRWQFVVAAKGPGRRRLDGPVEMAETDSVDVDLLRSVRDFAHRQATKAGRLDA